MTKAELATEAQEYGRWFACAKTARKRGDFEGMLEAAVGSLRHIDGMMRYQEKFAEAEFESVETIDLILQFAPPLFAGDALVAVGALLREKKRIDKNASADLAAMLRDADCRMRDCHRIWSLLDAQEPVLQAHLNNRLGGDQAYWRGLAERMAEVGVVRREQSGNSFLLSLATSFERVAEAICPACGQRHRARKDLLLNEVRCLTCDVPAMFVICGE